MPRLHVILTDHEKRWIIKKAKKEGIRFSDKLRRIVDKHIENEEKKK